VIVADGTQRRKRGRDTMEGYFFICEPAVARDSALPELMIQQQQQRCWL